MTAQIKIDDPRLTAYALGELPANEMTEMAAAVAADSSLQAEIAAIRAFGATLTDELADEPAPELSASARAAIVTAGDSAPANDDDAPEVLARRWYAKPRFLVAAGLFIAAGAAAAIALSSPSPATAPAADAILSERLPATPPEAAAPPVDEAPATRTEPTKVATSTTAAPVDERMNALERGAAGEPAASADTSSVQAQAAGPNDPKGETQQKALSGTDARDRIAAKTGQPALAHATPMPDGLADGAAGAAAWDLKRGGDRGAGGATVGPTGGGARAIDELGRNKRSRGRRGQSAGFDESTLADLEDGGTAGGKGDAGSVGRTGVAARGTEMRGGGVAGPVTGDDADGAAVGVLEDLAGGGVGRAGHMSIPMLRGAGGLIVDSRTMPNGTVVTVQMPDGLLVRRYLAPTAAYDPNPYWFDPYTRRWYYDYEYYYYGQAPQGGSGETYAPIYESPFKRADKEPLSTFSTDVDTASYANVRRFLEKNRRPPRDAVRIEELVNAFTYDETPRPTDGEPLAVQTEVAGCPWAPTHRLVRVAIAARDVDRAQRPAGNLVFLVDTSGSMGNSKKLPLLKRALKALVAELDERDTVSIVTYAGHAGVALKPTNGSEKARILLAVRRLHAAGMTNGSAGLTKAYELAREHYVEGGTNRVLLATDGDFNAGMTSRYALVQQVAAAASENIYLTVLGLGTGNLDDDRLEAISNRGNGTYAYLDSDREARRVLVDQLTETLVTVAKDVKLQVEWNPAHVMAYRLIGYENRAMANRDFDNDRKDAGDLGAGATVTALYEVVPAGETPTPKPVRNLKYQQPPEQEEPIFTGPPAPADVSAEMMTVRVRYKAPQGHRSETVEATLVDDGTTLEGASDDFRWAAAIAGFGMMMRRSYYRGNAFWGQIHTLALGAVGSDPNGERSELLRLVAKAARLYGWR